LLKLKKIEISKLEKFHSADFFTILHMHSAFAAESVFALKK